MTPDPKPEPRAKKTPKRLKPMSAKRAAQIPAREECVRIVLARDRGCVFPRHWETIGHSPMVMPSCDGPFDVHEPGHRSQGADPTNPDECVTLCRSHHSWVHLNPIAAKDLAL